MIHPRRVTAWLALAAGTIVTAGIVAESYLRVHGPKAIAATTISKFSLNSEMSIPTLFSGVLLLGSAVLLGVLWRIAQRRHDPDRWRFGLLAIVFVYLSADELCAIHELGSRLVRKLVDTQGLLKFSWVILAIPALCLLAGVFLPMVRRLPARVRLVVVTAGVMYVGGAVGMEMIGGHVFDTIGRTSWQYQMVTTIEESLEMAGLIAFIYGLLVLLGRWQPDLTMHIAAPAEKARPSRRPDAGRVWRQTHI